jgi:hypothetical protein
MPLLLHELGWRMIWRWMQKGSRCQSAMTGWKERTMRIAGWPIRDLPAENAESWFCAASVGDVWIEAECE